MNIALLIYLLVGITLMSISFAHPINKEKIEAMGTFQKVITFLYASTVWPLVVIDSILGKNK